MVGNKFMVLGGLKVIIYIYRYICSPPVSNANEGPDPFKTHVVHCTVYTLYKAGTLLYFLFPAIPSRKYRVLHMDCVDFIDSCTRQLYCIY